MSESQASSFLFRFLASDTLPTSLAPISWTWVLVSLFVCFVLQSALSKGRLLFTDRYPPGPRGLPIIGNLLQLSMDAWVPMTKLKEKYGNIVYLDVAGQQLIVMNSYKAASGILDKRANITSDKVDLVVVGEFLTGGMMFLFMPYNALYRRMRRASTEHLLGSKILSEHHHTQQVEATLFTDGLLRTPDLWESHSRRASASMIMTLVYNKPTLTDENDPAIAEVNDFGNRIIMAGHPGSHPIVEFFPWIKYLPAWMAKWKRDAQYWYQKDTKAFIELFSDVRKQMADGDQRTSFVSAIIQDEKKYGLSEVESAWLAAMNYVAGSETTATTMTWFLLIMIAHPEYQKKAQEELDDVVGRGRMPTFADYERLPYVRALVQETLRYRPVAPLIPHKLVQDDVYEGYFLPKNAIIIANAWAINHDPELYGADAHLFNPTRHLDSAGNLRILSPDMKEDNHGTYGFGKRICPGRQIANNSLFIEMATTLWALDLQAPRDAQGQPVVPDLDVTVNTGNVIHPLPFDIITQPRFKDADILLAHAKESLGL